MAVQTEVNSSIIPTGFFDSTVNFTGGNSSRIFGEERNRTPAATGDLPEWDPPNIESLRHLMRNPQREMRQFAPICLFVNTKHCNGTLVNGLCETHLSLLNITHEKYNRSYVNAQGQPIVATFTTSAVLFPMERNLSETRITKIFPFIENSKENNIGYIPNIPGQEDTRAKIICMRMQLEKFKKDSTDLVIRLWRNYMSNFFNLDRTKSTDTENIPNEYWGIISVNNELYKLDFNKCTLITQALMALALPQITSDNITSTSYLGPANMGIFDDSIGLVNNLLPFGTVKSKGAEGSILVASINNEIPKLESSRQGNVVIRLDLNNSQTTECPP
jgi:hypothetical protein